MRPFKIGIGREIKARLKPGIAGVHLSKMHRYYRSMAYLLACAQSDAMRHDIAGNPVEPDRLSSRQGFAALRAWLEQRRKEREAGTRPQPDEASGAL